MSYRALPSIGALLDDPRLAGAPRVIARRAAREVVDEARSAIRRGEGPSSDLVELVLQRIEALRTRRLRRVINASGVVLHTNLGRAPLAEAAQQALLDVAGGYSNAEMVLGTGQRGGRLDGVGSLLRELTGAEAALVVNNNAAAVLLVLTALAHGREVVVSRGELVEIGGAFRVPEVVAAGGAALREVGTTNRTRVSDYAEAIGPQTALLLRVHPSNFRVVGFTERPGRVELAKLGRERGLPLVEDLGSGLLSAWGAGAQPWMEPGDDDPVERAVEAGVDLVCFSGDKLLGGPQAGIIVGRATLVARLAAHPLYRALRVCKLTLAALEATLLLYREGRADEIPTRALLSRSPEACREVAERLAAGCPGATIEQDIGYSGGGALPARGLPTAVVAIRGGDPAAQAARLRAGDPPIVARVARDALIIDPRTLLPGEEATVTAALARIHAAGQDR